MYITFAFSAAYLALIIALSVYYRKKSKEQGNEYNYMLCKCGPYPKNLEERCDAFLIKAKRRSK